jgi:TRAP-type mannitol/chloroaromatic compound transport system permease small subunit
LAFRDLHLLRGLAKETDQEAAMKTILLILDIIDKVNSWVARIALYVIFPLVFVSMYEIIARYVFDRPTLWAGQIISILFMVMLVPAGGYVILNNGHVRMDVLYSQWDKRRKAIVDAATFVVFFCFAVMLSWKASEMAWISVSLNESSFTYFHGPIYPKKIALAIGAFLLLSQGIAQFIRNILFIKESKQKGEEAINEH